MQYDFLEYFYTKHSSYRKNYSSFLDFTRNYERMSGNFVPWSSLSGNNRKAHRNSNAGKKNMQSIYSNTSCLLKMPRQTDPIRLLLVRVFSVCYFDKRFVNSCHDNHILFVNRKRKVFRIFTVLSTLWSYYYGNLGFITHSGVVVKLPSNKVLQNQICLLQDCIV